MYKPECLRAVLLACLRQLDYNPDRLQIYIDRGSVRATATQGLSFEYSYQLNVLVTDLAGKNNELDLITLVIIDWLRLNQPEILQRDGRDNPAFNFEVDLLDNHRVDIAITLNLTERVIVSRQNIGLKIDHPPEPVLNICEHMGQNGFELIQVQADGTVTLKEIWYKDDLILPETNHNTANNGTIHE